MRNLMGEYEPWKELGISELEYWKKQYLEERKRISQLESCLEKAEAVFGELGRCENTVDCGYCLQMVENSLAEIEKIKKGEK